MTCISFLTLRKAYKNRAFNQKVKAKKLQRQGQVTKQEKNPKQYVSLLQTLNC